jgi:hypothetical protein
MVPGARSSDEIGVISERCKLDRNDLQRNEAAPLAYDLTDAIKMAARAFHHASAENNRIRCE